MIIIDFFCANILEDQAQWHDKNNSKMYNIKIMQHSSELIIIFILIITVFNIFRAQYPWHVGV